jgi:hypothetical protein
LWKRQRMFDDGDEAKVEEAVSDIRTIMDRLPLFP